MSDGPDTMPSTRLYDGNLCVIMKRLDKVEGCISEFAPWDGGHIELSSGVTSSATSTCIAIYVISHDHGRCGPGTPISCSSAAGVIVAGGISRHRAVIIERCSAISLSAAARYRLGDAGVNTVRTQEPLQSAVVA